MEELSSRRMMCVVCGFEAHSDEVLALWAMKRFHELTTPLFLPSTPSYAAPLLWKLKKGAITRRGRFINLTRR
jgi:transposase